MTRIQLLVAAIRPSNMRTAHSLLGGGTTHTLSVSAVACVEELHTDPYGAAVSGSGMDAPDLMPAGSVKAFPSYLGVHAVGFCQRDVLRAGT